MSLSAGPFYLLAAAKSVVWLSAWLFVIAIVFVPVERLFALHPRRFFCKALFQDIGYYFISGLIPGLLLAVPFSIFTLGGHALVPHWLQMWISQWPLWGRIVAGLIVGEIGFYWGHRWAHAIPLLWRFHSIHHSAERIYFLISSRAHPIDNVFIRLCGLVPVYVLGIATPLTRDGGVVSALLVILLTAWGFLIHANVRWRLGPVEQLIATPAFHHWHHTVGQERDCNYASMLPWIDRLFGTYHLPRDRWPSAYGIETPLPTSLVGQMAYPFHPDPSNGTAAVRQTR